MNGNSVVMLSSPDFQGEWELCSNVVIADFQGEWELCSNVVIADF